MRRSSRLIVSLVVVSLFFAVAVRSVSAQSLALNDAKAGQADAKSLEPIVVQEEGEVVVLSSSAHGVASCGDPCAAQCSPRPCLLGGLFRRSCPAPCATPACAGPVGCQSDCTCGPVGPANCAPACPPACRPGLFARLRATAPCGPNYGYGPAFNAYPGYNGYNGYNNCAPAYGCPPRYCGQRAWGYNNCQPAGPYASNGMPAMIQGERIISETPMSAPMPQ